jgi:hypothetical protein
VEHLMSNEKEQPMPEQEEEHEDIY